MSTENRTFGDARLEELKFVSELDRQGRVSEKTVYGPRRDMLAFLISERYVNDLNPGDYRSTEFDGVSEHGGLPGESQLERKLNHFHLKALSRVLTGIEVSLHITHKGRIRLSELKHGKGCICGSGRLTA